MTHHPAFRRSAVACVLLALVAGFLFPEAQPAHATSSLSLSPGSLDMTIPLGELQQVDVTVANTSNEALNFQTFEASPASTSSTRAISGAVRPRLPEQTERFDAVLASQFRSAPAQDFVIYLNDQADLAAAYQIRDWAARGQYVYNTLRTHAITNQQGLLRMLRARGVAFRSMWIVNAVLVHGTQADASAALARADVAMVRAERQVALSTATAPADSADACSPGLPQETNCWNIRQIGADRVWRDFGVTGRGITVANLDTGVAFSHPALQNSYRGFLGNGVFDHNYNWYDPQGTFTEPQDGNGHGSHTMGIMVGAAVNDSNGIGVAPGASWIAAQGCEGIQCNDSDLIFGAEWLLAPTRLDGSNPRPDLRPMIINNSWSGLGGDPWYTPYTTAWRAAGIFPVFAAGNATSGVTQTCGSVASPGDYSEVVAVGAVGDTDTIASFSLLGPARNGNLKPDFTAPGVRIYSSVPSTAGNYRSLNGTSMAAPHLAATVALLWSANPALVGDYDGTYALLRSSAKQISDDRCGSQSDGANNIYGYGRIDAYQAVAQARVDIPWLSVEPLEHELAANDTTTISVRIDAAAVPTPGTYQARIQFFSGSFDAPLATLPITVHVTNGQNQVEIQGVIVNKENNQPIQATIAASRDSSTGVPIPTASDGSFTLTLASNDDYDLLVSAPSFVSEHVQLHTTASTNLTIPLTPDLPRLVLPAGNQQVSIPFAGTQVLHIPLENQGTQPLYYRAEIPPDAYSVARSDEGGPAYSWIDLPADAKTLTPSTRLVANVPMGISFPFYSYVLTDTVLSSDGMIAFDRPITYQQPTSNCLPDQMLSFYMIAPLRLATDTLSGGQIRYATVDSERFVVSYENIAVQGSTGDQRYTFQAILHTDGRVVFQYKQLGALPSRASAGIQRSPLDILEIGCGTSLPIQNELAITFRPQPRSTTWADIATTSGTLQPGEQATIDIDLHWQRPAPNGEPYQVRVQIASNDPRQTRTATYPMVSMQPGLYEVWLLHAYQ